MTRPHVVPSTPELDAIREAERLVVLTSLTTLDAPGGEYLIGWIGGVANSELPAEQKVARILGACDAMTEHRRGRLEVVR